MKPGPGPSSIRRLSCRRPPVPFLEDLAAPGRKLLGRHRSEKRFQVPVSQLSCTFPSSSSFPSSMQHVATICSGKGAASSGREALSRTCPPKFSGILQSDLCGAQVFRRLAPVIDLSALNRFLLVPSFSMETAESIRASIPPDSWVASLDLKDAYFQIPVHPLMRKYLRFAYQGRVWQFCSLPFSLSPAPWIFTMVVKEIQVLAHARSIFLHQYLHDWVLRHHSLDTLKQHLRALIQL